MIVFIDESGDHNLSQAHLDNIYNTFVLAAVCFKNNDAYMDFDLKFKQVKANLFGTDNFIVHTSEITRPNRAKDELNLRFNDPKFRNHFYREMNNLITQSDFVIIPRVIDKYSFAKKYNNFESKPDPYNFSFDYILNRVFFDTKSSDSILIYPESRNHVENRRLRILFNNIKIRGTKFIKPKEIKKRIKEFKLIDKSENDSGLQLADLIVTPIGRHFLGKKPRTGNEISFNIIKSKFRNGRYEVFP